LPTQPDSKDQRTMKKLQSESGANFDKTYIDSQVSAHKDTVKLFEKEAKSGKDPELKAFASQTLPTLQEHLQQVQGLAKNTRGGGAMQSGNNGNTSGSGSGKS